MMMIVLCSRMAPYRWYRRSWFSRGARPAEHCGIATLVSGRRRLCVEV